MKFIMGEDWINFLERLTYRGIIGIAYESTLDGVLAYIIFGLVCLFAVIGVISNKRCWRYISQKYIDTTHENLYKWKVLVVRVNGSGALGEVLSNPIIAAPNEGYTQTFIGIGGFNSKEEAENALKYVKSKFARTMLGTLKITQDNNRDTWKMIPLQDFSSSSDIDWSASISNIDRQLYKKYGLSEEEIYFIDSKVKEME